MGLFIFTRVYTRFVHAYFFASTSCAQITKAPPAPRATASCRRASTTAYHSAISIAQSSEARLVRAGQSATTQASGQQFFLLRVLDFVIFSLDQV